MHEPMERYPGPGSLAWRVWGGVLILLSGWVALRMGLLDLTSRVTVGTTTMDVANTYATIDHPFHAARAATLLRSLQDGEILRWVGHHQGGYPVEFYPLGIAWLDVAIRALGLGSIPILAAHKIAVIIVFLLPAWSFWLLARGDRIHPSTAVLASAIHFSVPGHWLNGGYEELVGWGLVTNVAGASLAFLTTVALARFVLNREAGMGILATLTASMAAVTNPRSLFALVVAALAILLVDVVRRRQAGVGTAITAALIRIGFVGGVALLIAAPVVFALFRYNSLYFFLHYEFYDPIIQYWEASATAVTLTVLILAIAGGAIALIPWFGMALPVSQGFALAGVLYVLLTLWVVTATIVPPLVEQLEAPRLMPFQRQLMIWFGALAVAMAVRALGRFVCARGSQVLVTGVIGGLAILMLVAHIRPLVFVPGDQVGLREVSLTGDADHASLELAIELAEQARPDGTSIFVVGNRDDLWHQQLWAPAYSDARFYYDDWMWYWHDQHQGPYNPPNGYWMPNPTDALQGSYLDDHAIGVVVVTDMWVPSGIPPRESARTNQRLEPLGSAGIWDVYRVEQPASLVTNGNRVPVEISVENHAIRAQFDDGDGEIVIRQNWFPRWTAEANGEPVSLTRRDDGYMELRVPPGAVDVSLEYGVTTLDWAGRAASVAGIVVLIAGAWRGPAILRRFEAPIDHAPMR
jgi:hypothetical protein